MSNLNFKEISRIENDYHGRTDIKTTLDITETIMAVIKEHLPQINDPANVNVKNMCKFILDIKLLAHDIMDGSPEVSHYLDMDCNVKIKKVNG